MAMRTPCNVEVHSLQGRPELNSQRGIAEHLDAASGRYHVTLNSGETVALRPGNLRELAAPPRPPAHNAADAAAGGGAAAGFAMPAFLDSIEAKHVGMAVGAALVFLLNFC